MTEVRQAYAGLRVLDIAGPAGSYAGKLLAELGAEVLKIEPPGGDPGRLVGPFAGSPDPSRSLHWAYHNTSKRSVILDLGREPDRDRFRALAATADVLLDTATPGSLDALGLSFETLRATNPRLIQASLTPFGQSGPRRRWLGTDIIASAMGGLLYLGGMPESPPSWPGGEQSYQIGAAALAVGVGTALLARVRTGSGQRVDVSLQEATAVATENAVGFWTFRQFIRKRLGDKSFNGSRMVYRTTDGWVIGHIGGRWENVLDWMTSHGSQVEQFRSESWIDPKYRLEHFAEVEPFITEFLGSLPKEQIYAEGQKLRIVLGPVRRMNEVLQDPQLESRKFWIDLPVPGMQGERREAKGEEAVSPTLAWETDAGAQPSTFNFQPSTQIQPSVFSLQPSTMLAPGAPYRLSKTPWALGGPAPVLGESVDGWSNTPEPDGIRGDSPDSFGRLPLRGIRVVDFGTNVVVPMVCKTLASFGAEIVKIDSQTKPEGQRNTPVPKPVGVETLNTNWLFLNVNSDKRSIAINMTVPEARDFVKSIIAKADIAIDNFGVDPMPKWGMSAAELHAMNPDLIIVRCSVMGRTGPLQNYIGLGNTIMASAGINSITGFEGDPPVSTCTAHPDYSSNCHHALFSILAALYHRDRTGEGQVIDLSQTESTICFVGPAILDYTANGFVQSQPNNRHPQMAPHGVFRCAGDDRWLAIACPDDGTWQRLASLIAPATESDPRYLTTADRKRHEDDLDTIVNDWLADQDPFTAMERLQAAGVPAGVVQTAQDMTEADPHLAQRGFFVQQEHEEAGEITVMGPHIRLADTPARIGNPAPLLGEDNEWVMSELMGLDDEQVVELYVTGAVE